MKLEHLIQAYNFNKIPANINEEIKQDNERAGVIKFNKNINASYLLDDEDIIVNMVIFCNCITYRKELKEQLKHTVEVIKVLQKTIELLANVPQKEANMILENLGLFDDTFKEGKQIKHLKHKFKIQTKEGLLMFNVEEIH